MAASVWKEHVKVSVEDSNEVESSDEDDEKEESISLDNDDTSIKESNKTGNDGWADAIAKVLGSCSSKKKNNVVLCKAKKDVEFAEVISKERKNEVQVVNEKGTITQSEKLPTKQPKKRISDEKRDILERKRQKLLWENMGRQKPDVTKKEQERALARIATRGVVQLFNAVQQHQKKVGKKLKAAGGTEVKKEKALKSLTKGDFLDMLKGYKSEKPNNLEVSEKKSLQNSHSGGEQWSILRDDFMMGATMKDWDREDNSDEEKV
ncbi:RRP15-like protein [Limulus polyphemus]|uniref:RRP15-like protein n=1 Tax=Limulus polyphemus TaxID=6850 RepID=A0ABM1AZJ0_LIMPO|nr:RRP15-like protein [Limulus polyphemus]